MKENYGVDICEKQKGKVTILKGMCMCIHKEHMEEAKDKTCKNVQRRIKSL